MPDPQCPVDMRSEKLKLPFIFLKIKYLKEFGNFSFPAETQGR